MSKITSWWRKDAAVTHNQYGHGSITNFVACPKDKCNVYFYHGDCVREVWRYDLEKGKDDWNSNYND